MQPGIVRKTHWSMTKLYYISEILAIFYHNTLSICHETIAKFAHSNVNIVRFCK